MAIFMGRLTTAVEIVNFHGGKAANGVKNGLLVACTELQQTLSVPMGGTAGIGQTYFKGALKFLSFHSCAFYKSPIPAIHSILPF